MPEDAARPGGTRAAVPETTPESGGLGLGSPAPDVTLLGAGDRPVRLSDLWSRQPLVLVFLRHFG